MLALSPAKGKTGDEANVLARWATFDFRHFCLVSSPGFLSRSLVICIHFALAPTCAQLHADRTVC